ncbi:MAG TPA: hypothetical protein VF746_20365 [Longimicrobium sp.]|jgi:hypothetical protein
MKKLFTAAAALGLAACAGSPAPADAPRRQARVCVTNEGYALISVQFRQRDASAVTFRAVTPGLTECRRVMLGNAGAVVFVESGDQRDETIDVGLVRPGNTLAVTVPRSIAQTRVMEYQEGR